MIPPPYPTAAELQNLDQRWARYDQGVLNFVGTIEAGLAKGDLDPTAMWNDLRWFLSRPGSDPVMVASLAATAFFRLAAGMINPEDLAGQLD